MVNFRALLLGWIAVAAGVADLAGQGLATPGVMGGVRTVDGGSLEGVRVHASCGGSRDSTTLTESGRFEIPLACAGSGPALEIIDPLGRYLPTLPTIRPVIGDGGPAYLLVPRTWRIDSGTHAGTVVQTDLRGATAPACRDCSAFYWPEDTVRMQPPGIPVWLEHSLPLRVAFSREDGDRITEADSVAFMEVTTALEADLGRRWFQPSRVEEIFNVPPGDRVGSVIVVIDPLLSTIGRGNWVGQRGEIVAGIIYLQSPRYIRDPEYRGVVAHELMHTLGFGHTCSWRSVMVSENCGRLQEDAPTSDDVAHAQLLHRLRTIERSMGIYGTITATLAGMEKYPLAPAPPAAPAADSVEAREQ